MPTIFIDNDGLTQGIASSVTRLLELSERRRVSCVEPVHPALRWMFHTIRRRVSDDSRLARFTRHWQGQRQARLFDGPVLGPFRQRSDAIDAEICWINFKLEGNTSHE